MSAEWVIDLWLPLLGITLIFWSGVEFGLWLARVLPGVGTRPPWGRRGTSNTQHPTPNIQRGGENVSGDRKLALTPDLSPEEREKAAQQHSPTRVLADGHIGRERK